MIKKTRSGAKFHPYPNPPQLVTIPENSPLTMTNNDSNSSANAIFNSLRIPDAIKDLPRFDGDQRLLHEFINNVEEILLHLRGIDGTPYAQILLRAIRNKVDGEANEVLNMHGTPLVWDEIKKNLTLHYSDKRTETSLIKDLHNLRQSNTSIEQFYKQIVEIQSALNNNILIHERENGVIKAKKDLFAGMCLNTFLTGLREPLGSTVRAMRPDSLASAFAFCIEEQNIFYQKKESFGPNFRRQDNYRGARQPFYNQTYRQSRTTEPNQINRFQNQPQTTYQYNRPNRNFIQTNRFSNPYNRTNTFEPMDTSTGMTRQSRPERMDVESGHTNRRSTMSRNTHQSTYSQPNTREIYNFNSESDLVQNRQTINEEGNNIEDSQNFPMSAWPNQQVT